MNLLNCVRKKKIELPYSSKSNFSKWTKILVFSSIVVIYCFMYLNFSFLREKSRIRQFRLNNNMNMQKLSVFDKIAYLTLRAVRQISLLENLLTTALLSDPHPSEHPFYLSVTEHSFRHHPTTLYAIKKYNTTLLCNLTGFESVQSKPRDPSGLNLCAFKPFYQLAHVRSPMGDTFLIGI